MNEEKKEEQESSCFCVLAKSQSPTVTPNADGLSHVVCLIEPKANALKKSNGGRTEDYLIGYLKQNNINFCSGL